MRSLNPFSFLKGLGRILGQRARVPPGIGDNPVLRLLLSRRSVRAFREERIPDPVMQAILEAGRLAPCTVNLQSWSFGVYDRAAWQETFGRMMPFKGDRAVIVCADVHRIRTVIDEFPHEPLVEYTFSVVNASIAAYAMNIAAEACGVSSVMLSETGKTGFYDALYLKETLGLPDGVFPVTTIVFGYAAPGPTVIPPKLPLEAITFTGRYKEHDPKVMSDWIESMMAGYRAMFVTKGFRDQLAHYNAKANEAEIGLREMIYYKQDGHEADGS